MKLGGARMEAALHRHVEFLGWLTVAVLVVAMIVMNGRG